MNKIYKKIILVISSSLLLFTSVLATPMQALAQESTWYNSGIVDWYTKVYGDESPPNEIFGERYTAAQVQWILYSLFVYPLNTMAQGNTDGVACVLRLAFDSTLDITDCVEGFVNMISNAVSKFPSIQASEESGFFATVFDTSNRSFSGINYVEDKIAKFTLIPTAQAQGFGYSQFGIIRDSYWAASRNAAYFLSVLVIIVFAFMIMFRVKISPQVVISVQSALPKVIIAIILATFSYAIAGFVVDLMYVVAGLLASLLHSTEIATSFSRAYNIIIGNPLGFTTTVFGGPITILLYMLLYVVLFFVSVIWNFLASFLFSLSLITGGALGIVGILVTFWLIILMVWYMIKIPWVLIKTTINIYLSIIIAPLQIMFGVFAPNAGFGAWLKNLIANVMVFPLTGLMMFLAYDFLMFSYTTGSIVGALTTSAQPVCNMFGLLCNQQNITMWSPPLLGQDVTGFIMLFISFGVIIAIPKATDILKMMLLGEKFAFGSAIGDATVPAKLGGGVYLNRTASQLSTSGTARGWGWLNRVTGDPAKSAQWLESVAKMIR